VKAIKNAEGKRGERPRRPLMERRGKKKKKKGASFRESTGTAPAPLRNLRERKSGPKKGGGEKGGLHNVVPPKNPLSIRRRKKKENAATPAQNVEQNERGKA